MQEAEGSRNPERTTNRMHQQYKISITSIFIHEAKVGGSGWRDDPAGKIVTKLENLSPISKTHMAKKKEPSGTSYPLTSINGL